MVCELCGKDVKYPKQAVIEGSMLMVCNDCTKFGVVPGSPKTAGTVTMPSSIKDRLEARNRRRSTRDMYESVKELSPKYPSMIRNGRQKKGMSQDGLASSVKEKVSVIKKIETGSLKPSESLRKKLERSLDISLLEDVSNDKVEYKTQKSKPLTLADMIKRE